jgi:hypothetical protein
MDNDVNVYTGGVAAAWTAVITFVPRLIAALVIFAIGYFIAKAVRTLIDKGLERVGFDRAIERGGIKRAMAQSGHDASDMVAMLGYYTVMLFTLQLAFGAFGPNPISALINNVIAFLPNVFVAMAIIVIAAYVASAVRDIVRGMVGGLSYGGTLANVGSGAILVIGVFAALTQLQIAPAIVLGLFYSMLAIIVGSAIVAIGGGGIVPMRSVWERTMTRVEQEAPRVADEVNNAARLRVEPGGATYQASDPVDIYGDRRSA